MKHVLKFCRMSPASITIPERIVFTGARCGHRISVAFKANLWGKPGATSISIGCAQLVNVSEITPRLVWEECKGWALVDGRYQGRSAAWMYRRVSGDLCELRERFDGIPHWWRTHARALRYPPFLLALKRAQRKRRKAKEAA